MSIEVRHITKTFGDFTALADISLQIHSGQLLALLGPSGCGKTTLLKIVAGLEQADSGQLLFEGVDATDKHVTERGIGFVFQHYALFRHMTVFDNIAFGLNVKPRRSRPSKAQIHDKVHRLLKMVQLDWLADAYPSQLSGGQRQRIALARSLAVEPQVLLLDEPFGALDARVRKDLRRWLRQLHDEIHLTSIFVTHDQEEALEVSDRVVVMNHGRIEQVGTPDEIYENPASAFVTQFLGDVNLFHGRIQDEQFTRGDYAQPLVPGNIHGTSNDEVTAYIRPHDIELTQDASNALDRGTIEHVHAIGPVVRLELARTGSPDPIEVVMTRERYRLLGLNPGDTVYVKPRKMAVFTRSHVSAAA